MIYDFYRLLTFWLKSYDLTFLKPGYLACTVHGVNHLVTNL